ncbi:MAG: flagellar basal body-associated FliL family protein [Armatimonadetes bacterium]|nr:flagellar basal body-associated FliL family protein [Armatimonadota bacterium]
MNRQNPHAGKGLVVMIVVIVLVLAAGAGGVVLGAKILGAKAHSAEGKTDTAAEKSTDKDHKPAKETHAKSKGKGEETSSEAVVVDLGEFLVNLEGGAENRYLRAEVAIRIAGLPAAAKKSGHGAAEDNDLPDDDLAVAKDCVTTVLSSGVFAQLRTSAGRAKLKAEVQSRLAEALPDYTIHEVLFTSFVMQ